MVLERNMFFAKEAVAHARLALTLGATNKWKDLLRTRGESMICVVASRGVEIAGEAEGGIPWLRAVAAKAEHVGCGNCGENAAIAFMYLFERGIRPLDFMSGGDPVDHAFVLIGRPRSGAASDPKSWGTEAVICDPWHEDGGAYLASEFLTRMYKGEQMVPESIVRAD